MIGVVTVKLPRNPKHDPRNKKSGICPISLIIERGTWCTDTTGSHHSYVEKGANRKEIENKARSKFKHITRIELFEEIEGPQ